ncbi:MAG: RlmE family RNA methyltransferase [bacterium]|nr:RlmE family RNA methyltransferase [bacterium]
MPQRYTPNDKWSRRAAEEGFRARSVYKLAELDQKYRLLKNGMTVLDLGAAPGSWLQYVADQYKRCRIIGIDLQNIEPIEGVTLYKEDITDIDAIEKILATEKILKFDLIISDLAPATSGIKDVDQWKSIELSQSVVDIAEVHLKSGGTCVMKVLRGSDFDEFLRELKLNWQYVHVAIATASRDRSSEVYVILSKQL